MVLLAAAIFSKDGKALLSRQFVEMSRARIEGLLTAFPKLIGTDDKIGEKNKSQNWKQHTFVETESVRYVYQPLEKLYVLLLTTKASNILEDLETLRLFAKVIPEYSRSLDEYDIKENIFDIIFAFDEIVALGYRENVNLAQIRTFTEMDSHEEKVFLAVRENQEKEAKENMKRKAKELQARRENKGGSYRASGYTSTGFGSSSLTSTPISQMSSVDDAISKPPSITTSTKVSTTGKAMRLGSKGHVVDNFVDQLVAEGVAVEQKDVNSAGRTRATSSSSGTQEMENIHIQIEEKLKVDDNHNSGLSNMEVLGMLTLRLANKDTGFLKLKVDVGNAANVQTHPNIDKRVFQTTNVIQPKSSDKAFPSGQDVSLLKWRFQTQDELTIPLKINCWPNKTGGSGCSVNIEYILQNESMDLRNVAISIPLPAGSGAPIIKEYDGEYSLDARKTHLQWSLPVIDRDNSTGAMEFETKIGQIEDFFPVFVSFSSDKTLSGLKIMKVTDADNADVKFSSDNIFTTDKYEIV